MRLIRLEWKTDKGRLIRVVKRRNKIVAEQPTKRILTPIQQEKVQILTMLSRRRKKKEKELKDKLKRAQTKFERDIILQEKQKSFKQFCIKCKLVKNMKPVNYGVTETGLLFVQGECLHCGKKNIARVLRKATEEEKKVAGVQKYDPKKMDHR